MFWKRKQLSTGRRVARQLVWGIFLAVVVARYGLFKDYYEDYHREKAEERRAASHADEGWTPGRGERREGRRGRERSPLPVSKAKAEVPPDFPRLHIEVSSAETEVLSGYIWNGWRGQEVIRPSVTATVTEGGTVYTNVAIQLKGSAGSFRPFDDKPALTLNFSKHVPGRLFHGFPKISLNNSAQDESFLSEIISREMFIAAGIPAPRADHATVVVNGRDLGLYVMLEGYGKAFLKKHFKDARGNLYDSGFCKDIDRPLDTNSGDHPEDHSDLTALARAAMTQDPEIRAARLRRVLDMDRFITLLAMESMLCHWDGYSMNRNNYRVFHDLSSDKMIFLPHGLDQMFGVRRASPESEILPPMRALLADAVMSLPGAEELYLERMAFLRTNVFQPEQLIQRVLSLAQRLRPTLAAYGDDFVQRHEFAVGELIERIVLRAKSVSMQLALLAKPVPASERPDPITEK